MRYSDSERLERCALARGFKSSNLSKAEYCQRHGLSRSSLDYWVREADKVDPGDLEEGSYFEVQVTDSAPIKALRQPDLEIELPLGVKLRFFGTGVSK